MTSRISGVFLAVLFGLGTAFVAPSSATADDTRVVRVDVPNQPTPIFGTLQNLPPLYATETYVAGDGFAPVIESYRQSGQYVKDQLAITEANRKFLDKYLKSRCGNQSTCNGKKATMVFDIDDTLLSYYELYESTGFAPTSAQLDNAQEQCLQPVITSTKDLYAYARSRGVSVFLITGRRSMMRTATQECLKQAGITGYVELIMRDPDEVNLTAQVYKSAHRAEIEKRGYLIISAIGDQVSDSAGGFTRRGFLLPNPMYYIP
ncbi:MAG: hypothetical protein KGN78_07805 [Actinomycetales bacterium]|nr:hypothetical protein [Actinomycetales bacterium]